MRKEKIKNIEKVVEKILREDELAQKDDCYLIFRVIQQIYPTEVSKTFTEVMFNAKNKGIVFESITRARRKLQKKYPELKDKETAEIRQAEEKEYIEYSREE